MSELTFEAAVALLSRALTAEDVFGGEDPAGTYRMLAKLVHPDVAPGGSAAPAGSGASAASEATRAFARLAELWAAHRRGPVLRTDTATYTIGRRIAAGDIADLVEVSTVDAKGAMLLKLVRRPADNDLMEREAAALRRLDTRGEPRHRVYAPVLVERFTHHDPATGVRRAANVLTRLDGFVTLAQVREAYPDGVDPRDVAWMWRRLLVAIGFAHRAGVVHGAVLPEHVLIHPGEHGLSLVDWCYAVLDGADPVPAMVARYRNWYPPEVAARQIPTPATDIHLATRCMADLMGGRAPRALARFARGCTLASPAARPKDAWHLLAELDQVLRHLYGPRVFRPFEVPEKEKGTSHGKR